MRPRDSRYSLSSPVCRTSVGESFGPPIYPPPPRWGIARGGNGFPESGPGRVPVFFLPVPPRAGGPMGDAIFLAHIAS